MESNDPGAWRKWLRTEEVADARDDAGELFRRSFGHDIPDYPRHFVLRYTPPGKPAGRVVAYVHQLPYKEVYLCGGMCVDERAYRTLPHWLYRQVRDEGGLATIVTRDSMAMLGDSPASFRHVAEVHTRAADLRTGFAETGHEHLVVYWRRVLDETEKRRLIGLALAHRP